MCKLQYSSEFRRDKFVFDWCDEEVCDRRTFVRGVKPLELILVFLWRLASSIFMFAMTMYFNIKLKQTKPEEYAKSHLYLTNWGDITSTMYFGLASVLYSPELRQDRLKDIKGKNGLSRCLRWITWCFYCCALQVETALTPIYWAGICRRDKHCHDVSYFNIHRHGVIALLLFIDFWISAFPIRILHSVYGMFFGLLYITASYKGHLDGFPPAYNELDWADGHGTIAGTMSVFMVFGPLIAQHIYFLLHIRRKAWIKRRFPTEDPPAHQSAATASGTGSASSFISV